MSDEAYGATIAKRRLARRLAQLRVKSGYTANHVCDVLNWGRGKVGRFEANQWKRPEMSDIRDLLRIYPVTDDEREEIEQLAIKSRARPWWREYTDIFENEFPGYENDATRIRVFMPLVMPGLLATADYSEALLRSGGMPPLRQRKTMETRKRRQEILERADGTAPRLTAVITEASLMYQWGVKTDRRDQIEHLIELSRRDNIELRIQRFADGPPVGAHSMVNIFGFADGEPGLVFVETDYTIQEVSDKAEVKSYVEAFGRACDAALEPRDTVFYLKTMAEQLE
ncbi:MAG: helix-turn-helix domain-containing protein [Actinobacteria bacterium]|nr:helix-turn-helix domain-containing protein [Actinomycetota bacterium]MBO0785118.1 helix-turn-helix domain-containing protein [Actinomycetota bacterium]MBO0814067.1 helix-turn-helix domain-containing protein [Actinomycetota bacterium]